MNRLFKATLIVLVTFLSFQTEAQSFIIKGGFNLSKILSKDFNFTYSDEFKMKAGFHLGLSGSLPINKLLDFEPGIMLSTKGARIKDEIAGYDIKATLNLYYLDVPLNIRISYPLAENMKLFAITGPYFGLGLAGKDKVLVDDGTDKDLNVEQIDWGNDEDYRRLDLGLNFGAGVEYNSFMFIVSYDLGLNNISAYQDNGSTVRNRVLKFTLGYRL